MLTIFVRSDLSFVCIDSLSLSLCIRLLCEKMKVAANILLFVGAAARLAAALPQPAVCPSAGFEMIYSDMHDGDKKKVAISGNPFLITIQPSGNNQSWIVGSKLDSQSCSALINFDVPGKPGAPPVWLQATFWAAQSTSGMKEGGYWGFTDPSGTLAPPNMPLNRWVADLNLYPSASWGCPFPSVPHFTVVFADMHDGDKKQVTIAGGKMTIKPSGNNQTWVVESTFNTLHCSASIDFNVPGKPGPPPVNLLATVYTVSQLSTRGSHLELSFTDPSGTLAPGKPMQTLNQWVQLLDEQGKDAVAYVDQASTPEKLTEQKAVEQMDGEEVAEEPCTDDEAWRDPHGYACEAFKNGCGSPYLCSQCDPSGEMAKHCRKMCKECKPKKPCSDDKSWRDPQGYPCEAFKNGCSSPYLCSQCDPSGGMLKHCRNTCDACGSHEGLNGSQPMLV